MLTVEGIKNLKIMCLRNLNLSAKEETEIGMLTKFMEKAKDAGWLLKNSAKAQKDIFQHFRVKRNYIKTLFIF